MKKFFTLTALAVLMFSCQKEVSYEDPNNPPDTGGGGANDGTKLTRIGIKFESDSLTINYNYDGSTRLKEVDLAGTLNGAPFTQNSSYTRNAQNIITREIYKSSVIATGGAPQLIFDYNYDNTNNRYAYAKITLPGVGVVDSIAYNYTNSRLSSLIHHANSNGSFQQVRKEEYIYSGTNVVSIKYYEYSDQAQDWALSLSENYEYDSNTNPLSFTSDAVVLANTWNLEPYSSLPIFFSSNNYQKLTGTDSTGSYTFGRQYTYNGNNRPKTATSTYSGGQIQYSYYYE